MRILLFCLIFFLFQLHSYCQFLAPCKMRAPMQFGVSIGMDQHVAGGGPQLEIYLKKDNCRFSVGLNTQINAFTPYKFQRFDVYRYAKKPEEAFGGGISVSYILGRVPTPQPIFPIITYSSNYFNTHVANSYRGEYGYYFTSSTYKYFSTLQCLSAGIEAYVDNNFRIDFLVGSGVYIVEAPYGGYSSGQKSPEVRPDFNLKLSAFYNIYLKRKKPK